MSCGTYWLVFLDGQLKEGQFEVQRDEKKCIGPTRQKSYPVWRFHVTPEFSQTFCLLKLGTSSKEGVLQVVLKVDCFALKKSAANRKGHAPLFWHDSRQRRKPLSSAASWSSRTRWLPIGTVQRKHKWGLNHTVLGICPIVAEWTKDTSSHFTDRKGVCQHEFAKKKTRFRPVPYVQGDSSIISFTVYSPYVAHFSLFTLHSSLLLLY